MGGASVGEDCFGSPDEWVFPRLVETTHPEVLTGSRDPVPRTLPDQKHLEEWIFSKMFQSDATPASSKCSKEMPNESALTRLLDNFFDMSMQDSVLSPFHAGVASGFCATPIGGSDAANSGNNCSSDTGAVSRDEKAEVGPSKSSVSSTSSGVFSGSSGGRERRVPVQGSLGGAQRAAAKTGIPRVARYVCV